METSAEIPQQSPAALQQRDDIYYRALLARDSRFDGVFFVAVKSTGIYCRSICPARKPRRDRCLFFAVAAAAELRGYRPCLRCRPELAPGCSPLQRSATVAQRVVARIESGALDHGGSVDTLASEFGVTARQLRRWLRDEFGVSPVQLAQSRRLLLAKQLLTETPLPMIEVADASGFSSVRRFNECFQRCYRLAPTQLRRSLNSESEIAKSAPRASSSHRMTPRVAHPTLELRVSYRPPLAWEPLLRFLEARAIGGVERIEFCPTHGARYHRTLELMGHRGLLSVSAAAAHAHLVVGVSSTLVPVLGKVLARVRQLFDLDANPEEVASALRDDPRLSRSVGHTPGLRVPGAFDAFELGWRAILGQQVSVKGATTLATRFAAAFGDRFEDSFEEVPESRPSDARGENHRPQLECACAPAAASALPRSHPHLLRLTPRWQQVARRRVETVAGIGIPTTRARSIVAFARWFGEWGALLRYGGDVQEARRQLLQLPGIGDWTAEYIAMRACHDPDAFPAGDLVLRQRVGADNARQLTEMAQRWRPWRAYAALHLWNSPAAVPVGVNAAAKQTRAAQKAERNVPEKRSR